MKRPHSIVCVVMTRTRNASGPRFLHRSFTSTQMQSREDRAEMARDRPRKNECRAKEGVRPQSGTPPLAGRINIVYQDKRIRGISGYFDRRLFGTQRPSEGQVNTSTQSSFYFGKESHGSSFVKLIV